MKWHYHVRQAVRNDLDTLVSFTIEEACEAEGMEKNPDLVRRGVLAGLDDPTLATYWVANSQDSEVVALISAVRNGATGMPDTTGGSRAFTSFRSIAGAGWWNCS